jgi:hypothetical protein
MHLRAGQLTSVSMRRRGEVILAVWGVWWFDRSLVCSSSASALGVAGFLLGVSQDRQAEDEDGKGDGPRSGLWRRWRIKSKARGLKGGECGCCNWDASTLKRAR